MNEIDGLIANVRAVGRQLEFSGPQTELMVQELERGLKVCLPPSFREFLMRFGGGGEPGAWLTGIYENEPLMEGAGSVYGETLFARETYGIPDHFVVIYSDDDIKALWCLDMTDVRSDGECPVVSLDVNTGAIDNVLAPTFGAFFEQYLRLRTHKPVK
jgi:hypothetical protein